MKMKDVPSKSDQITLTSDFFSLTKKEIVGQAKLAIAKAQDKLQAYSAAMRLEEMAKQMKSELKDVILSELDDEPVHVAGGQISWRGGGVRYAGEASFGHWDRWSETNRELDRLEGLMKAVAKAGPGASMVDTETGEEVPAAKPITTGPQLIYKY